MKNVKSKTGKQAFKPVNEVKPDTFENTSLLDARKCKYFAISSIYKRTEH